MFGRKTLPFLEPDLSLGESPSRETIRTIGRRFTNRLKEEIWSLSQPTSEFVIIGLSRPLLTTIRNLFQLSEKFMFSGEKLELVRVSELGLKPVYTLIAKIHEQNGGMVTAVKNMLFSVLNF